MVAVGAVVAVPPAPLARRALASAADRRLDPAADHGHGDRLPGQHADRPGTAGPDRTADRPARRAGHQPGHAAQHGRTDRRGGHRGDAGRPGVAVRRPVVVEPGARRGAVAGLGEGVPPR
ncbi:hypothetical protein SDC9_125694 [bioreactor metagenome]|uniref:Uncharacterized protein n=1 Tax=bioreactor metagenome TaxID=1076179 RepID=A0A645CP28_9ZZZZ